MSPRRLIRPPHRLGRRGAVLLGLGLAWVIQGLSVLTAPASPTYPLLAGHTTGRVIMWVLAGAIAISCAWLPQGRDRLGFLALYVPAAYRLAAYGTEILHEPRAIIGVMSWLTIAYVIVVVAGWEEPASHSLSCPADGSDQR